MRKGRMGSTVLLLGIFAVMILLTVFAVTHRYPAMAVTETGYTFVIDPGHGGADSGAIAENGTKESDINLSIALKISALADFCGMRYVLTRQDDTSWTEGDTYSEHAELQYRVDIVNNVPCPVYVGVHQNSFPTPVPIGSHVMYGKGADSQRLGKLMERELLNFVDSSNRRVASPVPESLFITANVSCPAVLVECGFMSNPGEVEKLSAQSYQMRLALALVSACMEFERNRI